MNITSLNNTIKNSDAIIIYFSGKNCQVCKVLQPKIEESIKQNFDKIDFVAIKTEDYPVTCSELSIFSVPTILVYFDGKECGRYGRNISIAAFIQNLKRPYSLLFED